MGIIDRLKVKGKREKDQKEENVLDMVKESSSAKVSEDKARQLKEDTGRAHRILISGHVSEKANMLSNQNRYIFRVNRQANKIEVKKAVEGTYDVRVVRVNIVNNLGKNRRMGRIMGRTSDWKKAIVTLKQGDKISGLVEGA